MDHVGWDIIDSKRSLEGWLPVARMGLLDRAPAAALSPRLAALAGLGTPEVGLLAAHEYRRIPDGRDSEVFDRRQPEHIILAGLLGLGRFDASQIDHRIISLS
jgi:hypothetical protein